MGRRSLREQLQDAKAEVARLEAEIWRLRTRFYIQKLGSVGADAERTVPVLAEFTYDQEQEKVMGPSVADQAQWIATNCSLGPGAFIVAVSPALPDVPRDAPAYEQRVGLWVVQENGMLTAPEGNVS